MRRFQKIALLDELPLVDDTFGRLNELSETPIDRDASLTQADGADAAVVTWRTSLDASFFEGHSQLKFIAMAASPFIDRSKSSIDLDAANEHGVTVSALGQYGDAATAEWVLASVLNSAHHIDGPRWRAKRTELLGKQIGIVGLSHVGSQVAQRAASCGMNVVYSSRTEKPWADALGYKRVSLDELLATSDVVSVHVAKGVKVLHALHFESLRPDALLINTSIGQVMEPAGLERWLGSGGVCIGDATIAAELADVMSQSANGWVSKQPAADTQEMHQRRADQIVEALSAFLQGQPVRVVN